MKGGPRWQQIRPIKGLHAGLKASQLPAPSHHKSHIILIQAPYFVSILLLVASPPTNQILPPGEHIKLITGQLSPAHERLLQM